VNEPVIKILVINPGSSSTKIGLFENEKELWTDHIRHSEEELQPFARQPISAQHDFRFDKVREALLKHNSNLKDINAIVGRGGLLKPLPGGTYNVNTRMCDDLHRAERGDHASNLGALLAKSFADEIGCEAYIVDPVSVDEWPSIARFSGLDGLDRECLWHALNSRAVAHRFAKEQQSKYDHLRLIVAHLGSGISVSAHAEGRMIDVTNSREEGAFSTERAGGLPVMKVVGWCFSGSDDRSAIERKIFREGGIFSYLGTRDLHEVVQRIQKGDNKAALVLEGLVYQIAKEIGGMASVLHGRIDAILLTGGMSHENLLCEMVEKRVSWIARVYRYPGEDELASLVAGVLRVIRGEEKAREYNSEN
jgi:butyrate kinase